MVKGGWRRKHVSSNDETVCNDEEMDYSFMYSNEQIRNIVGTQNITSFVDSQHLKYITHVCKTENNAITKKMLFAKSTKPYYRDPWIKIAKLLGVDINQVKRMTQSRRSSSS